MDIRTYERLAAESSNYGNRPSSDSDNEDELLFEKDGPRTPGLAERGSIGADDEGEGLVIGGKKQRPNSLHALIISLILLILLASTWPQRSSRAAADMMSCSGGIGLFAAKSYTHAGYYHQPGTKHITMDHLFNGTFSAQTRSLHWVPEGNVNSADQYSQRFKHNPC